MSFLDFIDGSGADNFTSYDPSVDAAITSADVGGLSTPYFGSGLDNLSGYTGGISGIDASGIGGYFSGLANASGQLFNGLTSVLGGVSSALGGLGTTGGSTVASQLQNFLRTLGLQQPTSTTAPATSNNTLIYLALGGVILFLILKDKK